MRIIASFALVAGLGGAASANAFSIAEQDAKQVGRGNASAASDTDASSIFYNIGGLAVADGIQVSIGGTFVDASASYTDTAGSKTDAEPTRKLLPQIYASYKVNDLIAVGVGFYLPYGAAIEWPDSSPELSIIKKQELATFFITPSVGVNLDKYVPGLSLGAGLDIVPATVELSQYIYFGDTQGTAHLGGNALGFGGRVGAMYRPKQLPALSIGAMYRTEVKEDFTGKGDFDIDPQYRSQLPPDGDVKTSITLPQTATIGVAYRALPELDFEADLLWTGWSSFKEIRIDLPGGSESVAPQDYKDTWTIRVGAEYKFVPQHAAVRIGYLWDQTPIPTSTISAQLPDANRNVVTAGGSYSYQGYDLSLGLLYVLPVSATTDDTAYMPVYKGEYKISALVASLSLSTRFGK